RAEVRAPGNRRATRAAQCRASASRHTEQDVQLREPLVQLEQLLAAVANQILAKVITTEHLQQEPPEVSQPLLAHLPERAAVAPQNARGREGAPRRAAAEQRAHCDPYSWSTTTRSSVISRAAYAGPSRVFPESLTPP